MNKFEVAARDWAGLAKLLEEAAEVGQVAGKIIATDGQFKHWDGSDLRRRLEEEMGDLYAALDFVSQHCPNIKPETIVTRRRDKLATFNHWRRAQQRTMDVDDKEGDT